MSLTLSEIKKYHDKAYTYSSVTREEGANDLVFYWITQWDDQYLEESQLLFRGQFDIIRKAGRSILSDLASNPVQVDFDPVDDDRDDASDILDGMYRSDSQNNMSVEAFANAQQEMVVSGYGAWELFTEYESIRSETNKNQVIRRRFIPEANNTVFFDPNAKSLDKSDANYVSVLKAYSEDGYKDLVEDLTGEKSEKINPKDFASPEHSYTFPWALSGGGYDKYHVATFYHRELVKVKVLDLVNPFGMETSIYESELKDVMDDMLDAGFSIVGEKEVKRWQITKYIASGKEILNGEIGSDGEREGEIIAGENIPVVPAYGEHAIVGGEEHWEGVTRLAKDPQRLRNFQMSYLADIVSRSPRPKPIFLQEQVAGHEKEYEVTGADNNYAYLIQNRLAEDGQPLPLGPVGMTPEQPIPQALAASIQLTKEAVEDVANPGIPQDIADPDVSGKAVLALQNRVDKQSQVYQENMKHALRRDGEIYASMASEIYDVPRQVNIVLPDGTRQKANMMEQVVDDKTGEIVTLNDINNKEFAVHSKIGPSYSSQREQTLERIGTMLQSINPQDPMHRSLMLKYFELMDGVEFDDIRKHAKKELLLSGIREPENEEEQQLLAEQANQQQQPSPDMLLAQGEFMKGKADMMEAQRKGLEMQLKNSSDQTKNAIDGFEAQTDRMNTQIKAEESRAKIDNTDIDSFGKQIENTAKIKELTLPQNMSDDDLLAELMA